MSDNGERIFRRNLTDLGRLLAPHSYAGSRYEPVVQHIQELENQYANADVVRLRIRRQARNTVEKVLDALMPRRMPGDAERLQTFLNDEANDPTSKTFVSIFIAKEKEAIERVDLQNKKLKRKPHSAIRSTTAEDIDRSQPEDSKHLSRA